MKSWSLAFRTVVVLAFCGVAWQTALVEAYIPVGSEVLETPVQIDGQALRLVAYKTNLTGLNCTSAATCAQWLTLGYPRPVMYRDANNRTKFFHFSHSGFSIDLEFLGENERRAIAAAATSKFGTPSLKPVHSTQVEQLPLRSVNCSFELEVDEETLAVHGSADDLSVSPLRIRFDWPENQDSKATLRRELVRWSDSTEMDEFAGIQCDAIVASPLQRTTYVTVNTTRIDSRLLPRGATQTYLTETQVQKLATLLIARFNWRQKYVVSEQSLTRQFSQTGLIEQPVWSAVDSTLPNLSPFAMDNFGDDDDDENDRRNELLDALSRFFVLQKREEETFTVCADHDYLADLQDRGYLNLTSARFVEAISLGDAIPVIDSSCKQRLSVAEQLSRINNDALSDLRWTEREDTLVPWQIRTMRYNAQVDRLLNISVGIGVHAEENKKSFSLYARKQYARADQHEAALSSQILELSNKLNGLYASLIRLNDSFSNVTLLQNRKILDENFVPDSACRSTGAKRVALSVELCAARCYAEKSCRAFTHSWQESSCELLSASSNASAAENGNCTTYIKISDFATWRITVLQHIAQADVATGQLNSNVHQLLNSLTNTSYQCERINSRAVTEIQLRTTAESSMQATVTPSESRDSLVAPPQWCLRTSEAPSGSSLVAAGNTSEGVLLEIFQFLQIRDSYDSAKHNCERIGHRLGQIDTVAKWNALYSLISTNHLQRTFFAGFERKRDDSWHWYSSRREVVKDKFSGPFAWKKYEMTREPSAGDSHGVILMENGVMNLAGIYQGWQCSTLPVTRSCYYICTCP